MNHNILTETIDSPTRPITIVHDGVFTNAAISLLCRIEHFNNQIDHPHTLEKRLATIGIGCEILMEILDFCACAGVIETPKSKEMLAEFIDRKHQVEAYLKKQSWSEMLGRDPITSRKKEQAYSQLGMRFEDVFCRYFTILDQDVTDVIQAHEWHESWVTVVSEFSSRW